MPPGGGIPGHLIMAGGITNKIAQKKAPSITRGLQEQTEYY